MSAGSDVFFVAITSWWEGVGNVARAARPIARQARRARTGDESWNETVRDVVLSPRGPGGQIAAEAQDWLEANA